ncbi:VOC family protein [Melghirimyces algeriensis]|uniref:Catechol 2,3-dioxygenase n=1 Tax=Melghirimyces algeriensis TaxID=910412 RepID=A0A521CB50_9BACL|nr:VOC family protein [Melghirimyces algeriensis]SMO56677.1 Catechol 2,3-dioxygenase [Melghirimyces algeriensis]
MIKGLYEAHLPVSHLETSIDFYQRLGLKLAHRKGSIAFLWIEKEKSWLGLWECEQVKIPYHPSIRHIAFQVDLEDIQKTKAWLEERNIEVREAFGFLPEHQPLVLPNNPQAHASIYFRDPDDNSLELIAPLRIDVVEDFEMMSLDDWYKQKGLSLD